MSIFNRSSLWDTLDPAVDTCHIIGHALNSIYSQRKVSTEVPNQMIEYLDNHPALRSEELHGDLASSVSAMGQVHVQLIVLYTDILLCRPFFLVRFMNTTEREALGEVEVQINKLSARCVSQSLQAITMIKGGFYANMFPRFHPLALYILFESALVLLSSTYADIYDDEDHVSLVTDAISILRQWSPSSLYAEHFASRLELFRNDVERETRGKAIRLPSQRRTSQVKPESITTYEPSQYRSPFYPIAHDNLASPCDSRRGSSTASFTGIKQEGGGVSDTLGTRPLFSPMDSNTPRSQTWTEYAESTRCSDYGGDSSSDRKKPSG
ncbi:hypothetical protein F66182_7945 [Fusarium sp. NRRL 66182]|nr:hypothetical protein F66182_7945 [Fusarium sp. NRRL 66182]